jgi:hypothetical protein
MSTDMHNHDMHNHHDEAGYEHQDLSSASIFTFLIGLLVLGVVIQFAVVGTLHLFDKYYGTHQPRQNPLLKVDTETRVVTPATIEKFPQPRLEDSEVQELRDFREKEVNELNGYSAGPAGATRIPIDEAMKLVVERGLPTLPQAGTTPPSIVNTVNEAAKKSDTSSKASKKKK